MISGDQANFDSENDTRNNILLVSFSNLKSNRA